MMNITNEKDFENTVLQAEGPVLVDFWAPWCGYCRRLTPVIDRMESEYSGKIQISKLNIDDMPKLAETYEVDTIPTLILFQNGKAISSVINPESQDAIDNWLNENLTPVK